MSPFPFHLSWRQKWRISKASSRVVSVSLIKAKKKGKHFRILLTGERERTKWHRSDSVGGGGGGPSALFVPLSSNLLPSLPASNTAHPPINIPETSPYLSLSPPPKLSPPKQAKLPVSSFSTILLFQPDSLLSFTFFHPCQSGIR